MRYVLSVNASEHRDERHRQGTNQPTPMIRMRIRVDDEVNFASRRKRLRLIDNFALLVGCKVGSCRCCAR